MTAPPSIMAAAPAIRVARPEWVVIRTFLLIIAAGALLLMLPAAHPGGRWMDPVTALFTATSAACVTGLSVADTGADFSLFGQLVILALIQAGGIGVMTLAAFLLLAVGRRASMLEENVMLSTLGLDRAAGLTLVLRKTVLFTLLFEAVGTAVLAWRFSAHGMALPRAVYVGLFHAVSAFCNAGFSLFPDSLIGFRQDPWIVLTLAALLVSGGLGFLVWHELSALKFWRIRTLRGGLSLHTRMVLMASAVLTAIGIGSFLFVEWNGTLAELSVPHRLLAAGFQGVTSRTAGFNLVPMDQVAPPTLFMTIGLMFIGGAPCSTAGGIKVTTVVVMVLTLTTMLRGRRDITFSNRTLPESVMREAIAISTLGVFQVLAGFGLLLLTEDLTRFVGRFGAVDALLFEAVSAFGTTGLSTGITPRLSVIGHLVLTGMMFLGRLGPMTLASAIGRKGVQQRIRYPEEDVVLG